MYALVDCNNFYCSCERVFNPRLIGKPVVVLSNNDGCVIARSEEAKLLGIVMGTPAFMIDSFLKKHDVAVFSSNYTLYGDMSARIMSILRSFVPGLEIYSIDEAFLDLQHLPFQNLFTLGMKIKDTILQCAGIPVTVGIASTKTLAKMANRHAKKNTIEQVYHASNDILIARLLPAQRFQILQASDISTVCVCQKPALNTLLISQQHRTTGFEHILPWWVCESCMNFEEFLLLPGAKNQKGKNQFALPGLSEKY